MSWRGAIAIAFAVSLPVVVGFLGFWYQEREKRRAAHSERRRALYENLVRSLVGLLGAKTPEGRSHLLTEIETGWLFASDGVLNASYQYLAAYDRVCSSEMGEETLNCNSASTKIKFDDATREELQNRLADVFAEMRLDLKRKRKTTITGDWARQNVKIYSWGIISDRRARGPRTG